MERVRRGKEERKGTEEGKKRKMESVGRGMSYEDGKESIRKLVES